jgi:peptide chain release factor subunit 1
MQASDLTPATLRRLARLPTGGHRVLSLYLDLDPSEVPVPRDRQIQLDALLDEAERRISDASLAHDERVALRADIEGLRGLFSSNDLAAKGAHGLAVFRCAAAGIGETLRLARPVQPAVALEHIPWLEPLAALLEPDGWAVLLASRRTVRIFRGGRDVFVEVASSQEDVHRWHKQGGWSQARYRRSIEEDVKKHLKHASDLLAETHRRTPVAHLILAAQEEVRGELERLLPEELRERMAGYLDLDVERTSAQEIQRLAAAIIDAVEERRERAELDRLDAALGTAGRAAAGLDEVVGTLNEQRVALLLLGDGGEVAGAVCPRCGWLASGEGTCPVDGEPLEPTKDLREHAVERALAQSAEVLVLRCHGAELESRGAIAALLRY